MILSTIQLILHAKNSLQSIQEHSVSLWWEKEKLLVCFQQFLDNIKRRRRDLNPRAATNDLLPFQGSPFGQLGYFSTKRRGWDSNPRALSDKRFSRPPRYDHFDTSPWLRLSSLSRSSQRKKYTTTKSSRCQQLFSIFFIFLQSVLDVRFTPTFAACLRANTVQLECRINRYDLRQPQTGGSMPPAEEDIVFRFNLVRPPGGRTAPR